MISQEGIALIKSFEGCRLTAYKAVPTEKYWTIGYGHYGSDVKPNMVISKDQAERFLIEDLKRYEGYVEKTGLKLNQHQHDALVSFTYNCGYGNLKKLIANRTISEIGEALLLYNKSGGRVLNGLVRRRAAEKALFEKAV
jgi:GH24 family phage-related lysozyme (muramidase)